MSSSADGLGVCPVTEVRGTNVAAVIKVVGVGGGGCNAVNRMIEVGLKDVEFVAINTDEQSLKVSEADVKIDIGKDTGGLGAGSDPEVGRKAAEDNVDDIQEALKGANMVFVTAGEGGGTGTGAAPVVGRVARSLGALTVGVVTRPFKMEGPRRARYADAGIAELREQVDALITIPNQRLREINEKRMTTDEAWHRADNVLLSGVQGITDLITTISEFNVDFADVTTVLKDSGSALLGIGYGTGEDRAVLAAEQAISSPLLETKIDGARGVLVLVQGPTDLGLDELDDAVSLIQESADEDAIFKFGLRTDDAMGDQVQVTVVAAGFDTAAQRSVTVGSLNAAAPVSETKMPNSIPPSHGVAALRNAHPVPVEPALEPAFAFAAAPAMASSSGAAVTGVVPVPLPLGDHYAAATPEPSVVIEPPRIFEPVSLKDDDLIPDFLRTR